MCTSLGESVLLHGVRNYLLAARNEPATRNQVSAVITEAGNCNCNLSVASRSLHPVTTTNRLVPRATSSTVDFYREATSLSSGGSLSIRDTSLASFVKFPIPSPYFLNVALNDTFQCETVRRHSSATGVSRVKRPPESCQSPRLGHEATRSP